MSDRWGLGGQVVPSDLRHRECLGMPVMTDLFLDLSAAGQGT